MSRIAVDITDLDWTITANTAGGTARVNVSEALDQDASPYSGEILDSASSADGSGTAITATAASASAFDVVIPADVDAGEHFITLTLEFNSGATRRVSGPLIITNR